MALRGNLKDFSLPDVFQLVTFSKKTGVLRIRRADEVEGSVWFRDGDVFFAQSNWHCEPLGERMVTAQRITPNALSRALEVRASEGPSGRRLGKILIDEGYLSEKVLEAFVQEQIQDTIFDLMRWDEGEFDFEELPEVIEEDIGLSVSIENVVMEGARRLEEWTRIKKKVPSMDIVFKMATAPGEGTFEISLKPMEWQLLLLIDGTRSVADLAVQTGRTDFEVARIIYGLFSAGLLETAADDEVAKLREERGTRDERRAAIEREADLAGKSKAKRAAAREAEEAPAEPVASAEPAEPAEEPSFLTAGAREATAEDMAVFEQMMGAVLEAPAEVLTMPAVDVQEAAAELEAEEAAIGAGIEIAPAAEPEVAPEPEAEPEATAEPEAAPEPEPEEGAFMAVPEAPAEVTSAFPAVSEALEAASAESVAESRAEAASEAEPAPASPDEMLDLLAAVGGAPTEAPAEPPAPEELPPLTGDLEKDLMSLGLGELPTEAPVAEPVAGEFEFTEIATAPEAAEEAEPELPLLVDEGPEAEAEPDFTDLLSSLEGGAEDALAEAEGTLVPAGEAETAPSGVISTDAFLDEIGGDMDLDTAIGDELTALTGGGGGGARHRPAASVKKIPEPGDTGALHMDHAVDKELVLRIIDGIKNL